jgi:hypothetical protein
MPDHTADVNGGGALTYQSAKDMKKTKISIESRGLLPLCASIDARAVHCMALANVLILRLPSMCTCLAPCLGTCIVVSSFLRPGRENTYVILAINEYDCKSCFAI